MNQQSKNSLLKKMNDLSIELRLAGYTQAATMVAVTCFFVLSPNNPVLSGLFAFVQGWMQETIKIKTDLNSDKSEFKSLIWDDFLS